VPIISVLTVLISFPNQTQTNRILLNCLRMYSVNVGKIEKSEMPLHKMEFWRESWYFCTWQSEHQSEQRDGRARR
jgi:hypothetical protein